MMATILQKQAPLCLLSIVTVILQMLILFLHFKAKQKLYCFCQKKTDDGSQAMIPAGSLSSMCFNVYLQEEEDLVGE